MPPTATLLDRDVRVVFAHSERVTPPIALGQGPVLRNHPTVEQAFDAKRLHVEHHDARHQTRVHTQRGVEVHITVEGEGYFQVDGRNYLQTPRSGLVFRGDQVHQLAAEPRFPFQRTVICFDPQMIMPPVRGEPLLNLAWLPQAGAFAFLLNEQDFARVDEITRWLRHENDLQMQDWRALCHGALLQILALVRRNGTDGRVGEMRAATRNRRSDLVSYACAHVSNHLDGDLGLTVVASRFKVSPEHLTRSFSRHLGLSFHRYVLAERIAAAKRLLNANTRTSVTEIALATGFQSTWSFGRAFKQHTRMTPSVYRASPV